MMNHEMEAMNHGTELSQETLTFLQDFKISY